MNNPDKLKNSSNSYNFIKLILLLSANISYLVLMILRQESFNKITNFFYAKKKSIYFSADEKRFYY